MAIFGDIKVGEVADIYSKTGELGYAPISMDVPSVYTFINYKSDLQNKSVVSADDIAPFTSGGFATEADMAAAYNSCTSFIENVVWIFGNSYGGIALGKVDNDHVNLFAFYGINQVNGLLNPVMSTLSNISYTTTINNSSISADDAADLGASLEGYPTSGSYNTSFIILKINEFGDGNIIYHESYSIVINPACIKGIILTAGYPQGGVPATYRNIQFDATGLNAAYNWGNDYTAIMPDLASLAWPTYIFKIKRVEQFKIRAIQYQFDYSYYNMWNNTSLFGGVPNSADSPTGQPTSTAAGGYPGNNMYSDKIPEPNVPAVDLINTGFVRLYNPTKGEVQSFANFLFSSISDSAVNTIKKMLVNPLDGIMSLHMVHFNITTDVNPADITFCGVSSGVSANVVTSQYKSIRYGVDVSEIYKSFMDYSNFTKMRIYLPYCGTYEINPDEFMDGKLIVKYNIDIISGMCAASIMTEKTQKNGLRNEAPLYVFNGNCILTMPISATDWRNTFLSVIDIAGNAIAPSPAGAANIANDIFSQKVSTQKSGSLSSNFGYLSSQIPYLIIEHPAPSYPEDYIHWKGYPSNLYCKLKNIDIPSSESGMLIKVANGDLWTSSINATEEEKEEIKQLFAEGVWLRRA